MRITTQEITEGGQTYYLHTVDKGETLYSICRAYEVSQAEVQQDNALSGNTISAKQQLKIRKKTSVQQAPKGGKEQPQKQELPTVSPTANDANVIYVYHIAKAKETFYSIARHYNTTVKVLQDANPSVDVQTGRALRIPVTKEFAENQKTAVVQALQENTGTSTIEHVVKRKETLFSIARLYNVEIATIKQHNQQIFANRKDIKVGQTLQIPVAMAAKDKDKDVVAINNNCQSVPYTGFINVALLLPFDAAKIVEEDIASFHFVEFYEGVLMALNVLKQQGVNVRLQVWDTEKESVQQIVRDPMFKNMHLIIGPVYQKQFVPIAKFAQTKNIKIVSPLTAVDTLLHSHSCVYQVPIDAENLANKLLSHKQIEETKSNLIIISQFDDEGSTKMRHLYKQYLPKFDSLVYNNATEGGLDSLQIAYRESNYEMREHTSLVKRMSYKIGLQPRNNSLNFLKLFNKKEINRVIVASEEEPFVSELLANLKAFADRYKCRIIVYGTQKWRKFENIEIENFYDVKLHLASPYFTNYTLENVVNFVDSYRSKYKGEPTQFAFQGYDIALYFISAIHQYGPQFSNCVPNLPSPLLQSTYRFEAKDAHSFYENKDAFLLRYKSKPMSIVPYK
ncbi:peptidase M23 [Bacteroidia bacterium]|nr:peptidase M23 [Bacteroidia bacterium]